MHKLISVIIFSVLFFSNALAQEEYRSHKDTVKKITVFTNPVIHQPVNIDKNLTFADKPNNIILFIGDGMGLNQVYAAFTANGGALNMTNLPYTGYSITKSASDFITDSGAGGTALSTGHKTYNGAIGVDVDSLPVKNILEMAEEHGLKTGLIATSMITHATPASFIAHQKDRDMYEAIASDFLKTDIDLFIGGGRIHFERRNDKRNLSHDLRMKGYQVEFNLNDITDPTKPFVVFTSVGHNKSYPQRGEILTDAVKLAITGLQSSDKGFFMMVEGSQIDWGGHANDTKQIVNETLDFDQALGAALEFAAKDKNTLIIVTADHETGGMALVDGSYQKQMIEARYTFTNHTGAMVPVFAYGPGAQYFTGVYQNVEIFNKMKWLFGF